MLSRRPRPSAAAQDRHRRPQRQPKAATGPIYRNRARTVASHGPHPLFQPQGRSASVDSGLEGQGVEVQLFDRGSATAGEQEMPDRVLQLRMLEDGWDYNGNPGIAVMLTGDGAGYQEGAGFHRTLERMHSRGWRVEILSWAHSCNQRMRRWAQENGAFVALDDFYDSVTFQEPSRPGHPLAASRDSAALDLSLRPTA